MSVPQASSNCSWVRFRTLLRLALLRLAPRRLALFRSAPVSWAKLKSARRRSEPVKDA